MREWSLCGHGKGLGLGSESPPSAREDPAVGRANEPPEEDQGGDQDQAEDLVAAEEAGLGFAAGGFRQVLLVRFDETLSHESNRKLRHSIGGCQMRGDKLTSFADPASLLAGGSAAGLVANKDTYIVYFL
jgi:hypothetical protein